MKKLMLSSMVAIAMLSCSVKQSAEFEKDSTPSVLISQDLPDATTKDLYSDGKGKIIKTANYRFQVKDVKKSLEAIESFAQKFSAYISTSDLVLENPVLEERITIRVLSEYFDDLLKEIDTQAAFVNYRKISTDDVGKEFIDLESRLRTKRELEQRYGEILRKKAGTIEELLKVEKQIGELHEEIEATVSRINYLHDQVRYSTINLEFYQTITQQIVESSSPGYGDKFGTAFKSGLNGFVDFLITITYIWPIIFIGILTFVAWRNRKIFLVFRKSE